MFQLSALAFKTFILITPLCFPLSLCSAFSYRKPLSVVGLPRREEGMKRVVGRERETGSVDEKLAGDVEEDQEEVEGAETKHDVDLGNTGLLLEIAERRVLAELLVKVGEVVLRSGRRSEVSMVFLSLGGNMLSRNSLLLD